MIRMIKNKVILFLKMNKLLKRGVNLFMDNKIVFIYPQNNDYLENIAFVRALLIKKYIESLKLSFEEKEDLLNRLLEYLKNNEIEK